MADQILIVDDNPSVVETVELILDDAGYFVCTAGRWAAMPDRITQGIQGTDPHGHHDARDGRVGHDCRDC